MQPDPAEPRLREGGIVCWASQRAGPEQLQAGGGEAVAPVGRIGEAQAQPAPQLGVDGIVGEEGGSRLSGEGREATDGPAVRRDAEIAAVAVGLGDQRVAGAGRDGTREMRLTRGLAVVEDGGEGQVGGIGRGRGGVRHQPADRALGIR